MARNATGTYSLPIPAYAANTTIVSTDMNTNLSDIGTALTQSLATTGVSSMTGPIKQSNGTVAVPSLTYAGDIDTGFYYIGANSFGIAVNGTSLITFSTLGLQINSGSLLNSAGVAIVGVPIGTVLDYAGATAPSLFLLCFGQAISRATYSVLFALLGTVYGVGDGATTFNIPDLRGRLAAGKDDMGGAAASRITVAGGNFNAAVLGATGGEQNRTMAAGDLVGHTHTYTNTTSSDGGHTHTVGANNPLAVGAGASANLIPGGANNYATTTSDGTHSHTSSGTTASTGSGTAFTILSPVIILNKIIYAGV